VAARHVPSDEVEIEWQFDALDMRPVERWLASISLDLPVSGNSINGLAPQLSVFPKPTKRLVDTYLDTSDWRVGRAGYVLRARRSSNLWEVTLKDNAPAEGGLRKRIEITENCPRRASTRWAQKARSEDAYEPWRERAHFVRCSTFGQHDDPTK